jgi:S-adenosyl methyltransferase
VTEAPGAVGGAPAGLDARDFRRLGPNQFTPRTREEFAAFFDGLELIDPGLVPLPQWRALANPADRIPAYAALGWKS